MNKLFVIFALALGFAAYGQNTNSENVGKVETNPDGSTVLKLDGIDIEFDQSGQWSKIYSTYTHPVEFPDRRGIKKAQVIAEEKGKAQLIRFLDQQVESQRIVEEVDSTVQQSKRTQGTGSNDEFTKTSQRTMVESVKEFTRSYAAGNLRGVTILETGYNEKAGEVWVKLGISRKTVAAAGAIKQSMTAPGGTSAAGKAKNDSQDVQKQPSEVRTGRDLPSSDPPN
jgi:hypothetical protein